MMKDKEVEFIKDLVDQYGTTVKIGDVSKYGKKVGYPNAQWVVRKSFPKVSRGVYDISVANDPSPMSAEVNNIKVVEGDFSTKNRNQLENIENIDTDILIPKADPNYIPFGHYNDLRKVLKSGKFLPVFIVGDSGNGKTMGVDQACASIRKKCVIFNVTKETTEEDLIGSFVLIDGNLIWKDGPALVAMREGALLVLDEVDQASVRILALQTILQGNDYYNKKTNELIIPQAGFMVAATANTRGSGDETDRFIGAEVMNEAFLERFPITLQQNYPTATIERKILDRVLGDDNDYDKLKSDLIKWAQITRRTFNTGATEALISTRRLVQIITTFMVFNNASKAIALCTNRFDADTREAFINLYTKISNNEVLPEEYRDEDEEEETPF